VLRIEWDANLHTRVSRRSGQNWVPMTEWGPSEYLLREDDRRGDARRSDVRRSDAQRSDARHIAGMHPHVAVAFAHLLDELAEFADHQGKSALVLDGLDAARTYVAGGQS